MKPGSEEAAEHERMKNLSPEDQEKIKQIHALMQRERDAIEKDARKAKGMMENEDEDDIPAIDRMYNSDDWVKAQQDAQEGTVEDMEGGDLDVGHQDDEPNMLKKDIYDIAVYAAKLYKQLDKYDKSDGEVDFPHWWQGKVIKAREFISSAQHYLEAEEKQPAIDQLALENKVNENQERDHNFYDSKVKAEKVMQIAKDAIALMDEQPGTSAVDAIETVIEFMDESLNERSVAAIKKEYDALVGKMKQLAQHYKTAEGDKKEKIKDALLANTKRKRALEQELDDAVSGTGAGQELDTTTDEAQATGFGVGLGRSKTISKGRESRPDIKAKQATAVAPKKKYVMKNGVPHKYDANGNLVPLKKVNEYRGVQEDIIEVIKQMALQGDGDEIEAAMEIMEFIGEHYKIDFEFGRAGGGNYGRNQGNPYEGTTNEEAQEIDVYGYQTKHFDICPGAVALFNKIKAGDYTDGVPSSNEEGKLIELAKLHDALFAVEKIALKGAPEDKVDALHKKAIDTASDIYELGKTIGLDQNTDLGYIQGHVQKINDALRKG